MNTQNTTLFRRKDKVEIKMNTENLDKLIKFNKYNDNKFSGLHKEVVEDMLYELKDIFQNYAYKYGQDGVAHPYYNCDATVVGVGETNRDKVKYVKVEFTYFNDDDETDTLTFLIQERYVNMLKPFQPHKLTRIFEAR